MTSSNGRVARLTALALATGTLVAAGAGTASAANTTTKGNPLQFGQAVGSVLRIEINLPAALPSGLLPQHIVQDISLTDGTVDTLTSAISGNAVASLGSNKSNLPLVKDLLGAFGTEATLTKLLDEKHLVNIKEGALSIGVLDSLSKTANPVTTVKGVLSESHSDLAGLEIGAAGLGDALAPIIAALTPVLQSTVGTVATTAGTVGTTVTDTVGTLAGTLKTAGLPVDVSTALTQVSSTLTNTLTTLQQLPTTLAGADSLVSIKKLNSDRIISRDGDQLTAKSSNSLSAIDLLGGLVTVDALKSTAIATAAGVKNSAKASTPDTQIVHVSIKGIADLIVDKTGIHLGDSLGGLVPADLTNTVNGALDQLNGVTAMLGLQIQDGVSSVKEAADGRSAEASSSGAAVSLNPLKALGIDPAALPLLRLSMVNSNALVAATPVTLPVKAVTPPTSVTSLPRTGANLPLTGAIATGLVGLAMVARRRRMTHGA